MSTPLGLWIALTVWAIPLEPADVGGRARALLADEKFRFCAEEDFPLTSREARWCPVIGDESPRCPALVESCKRPRGELDFRSGGGQANMRRVVEESDDERETGVSNGEADAESGASASDGSTTGPTARDGQTTTGEHASESLETGSGQPDETGDFGGETSATGEDADTKGSDEADNKQKPDSKKRDKRRVERDEDDEPPDPPSAGEAGFGQVLFWLVIAAGALAILLLLWRARLGLASEDEEAEGPGEDDVVDEEEALPHTPARGPVLTDVEALLVRAEGAAAAGDYRRAIADCHAALLRNLEHAELITVIRSRTNGEYVRDLAGQRELQGRVAEVMRDVDRAQYGSDPQRPMFDRVLKRVRTLVGTGLQNMLLAVVATTIFACAWGSGGGKWKTYRWEFSPSGHGGLIELGETYGIELKERVLPVVDIDRQTSTLVLVNGADPEDEEWERLAEWVDEGGNLIVAGSVGSLPDWLGARRVYDSREVAPLSVAKPHWRDFGQPDLRVPGGDKLYLDDATPLLLHDDGEDVYAATKQIGSGSVITLADDMLLTNAALAVGDNAAFSLALLSSLGGDAEYIDASAWVGADTPFATVGRTELLPALLQGLALLVLLYLWRGVLFGAPRDPPRKSRRAFSQHVEAVGVHYGRAKVSRHAVRLYAAWAMARLRDGAGSSRRGLLPLAEMLAERCGRDETEIMRILVEADAATKESLTTDDPGRGDLEDLQLMQKLAVLVERAGGTR